MAYMLSTIDNPFNPHNDWDRWFAFDHDLGYYSTELLGRIAKTSNELSETDNELAIEEAINEIVQEDVIGVYIRVTPAFKPKPIQLQPR